MSVLIQIFAVIAITASIVSSQGQYRRVCYYTNWAQYRPNEGKYLPENVDPSLCTHIVYAFAKMKGNQLEAFEWNDESTEWMRGMYARFMDLKQKNPALKTLLAVGGWNMASKPFTAMVANATSRREFATTSTRFLRLRGFDGLDIDWEYPANRGSPPEDKERYTLLVSEVRRAFDAEARRTGREPLLLTSAVAAGKDKIDTAYNIPSICRDMDFISVMTYDLHGSWEDITGHNSPLFPHSGETGNQRYLNMDWAANYWAQKGCPKSKLVIGMGLYGRTFTLKDPYDDGLMSHATGKGDAGTFTREGGFLAYYEICDMIKNGAKTYYIKEQEAPYIVMGNQWIGYDDVDSLRIKVQWMKENGFSGVMVWALDLDDFNGLKCNQGPYPLMNAINNELKGTISTPPKSRPNRVKPDPAPIVRNNDWNNNQGQQTTTVQNLPHLTNEFKCPPNENTYFSSKNSCTDYFICASGLSFKFSCAPPLVWNSINNFCDWPENVICDKKPEQKKEVIIPQTRKPPTTTTTSTTTTTTATTTTTTTTTTTPRPTPTTRRPFRRPTTRRTFWRQTTRQPFRRQTTQQPFRRQTTRSPFRPQTNRPPFRRQTTRPPFRRQTTRPPFRQQTTRQPFRRQTSWQPFNRITTRNPRHVPHHVTQRPFTTTQSPISKPTPPWLDWSAWIAEFWRALTSMTGGPDAVMQQKMATAAERATSQIFGKDAVSPIQKHLPKQQEQVNFCKGKADGTYTDPLDCANYIECVQEIEHRGVCPDGTAFDSEFLVCNYRRHVLRCNDPKPARSHHSWR